MINLKDNELISDKDKDAIYDRFKYIENNILNKTNIQLLEIISELELTYKLLINDSIKYNETHNLDYHLQLDIKHKKK